MCAALLFKLQKPGVQLFWLNNTTIGSRLEYTLPNEGSLMRVRLVVQELVPRHFSLLRRDPARIALLRVVRVLVQYALVGDRLRLNDRVAI